MHIAFAITKFSFCGPFFKRILAWERGILKLIRLKNVLMKLTKIKNCWSGIFNYAIKNTLELLNSRLFNINIWHRWKCTSVCSYFIFWSMYLSRVFFNYAIKNTLELLNSRLFNINIWHRWKCTSVCSYFIFWSMYLSRVFFHAVRNQTSIKITKFNQKKIKKLMKRKCQVKF